MSSVDEQNHEPMSLQSDESRELSPSALITLTPKEALSLLGSAPEGFTRDRCGCETREKWPKTSSGRAAGRAGGPPASGGYLADRR